MNARVPEQHRSDRRAQTFRQTKHHRIRRTRQIGDRFAERRGGVEDPRAVQVHRQIHFVGPRANVFRAIARQNRTAGEIVRILERDQTSRRDIVSSVRVNRGAISSQVRMPLPSLLFTGRASTPENADIVAISKL